MTTENIPTIAEIQEATLNMKTVTEEVESTEPTLVDQYGTTRKTMTGREEDATNQLLSQEQTFVNRFALSDTPVAWSAFLSITNELQLYSTGVIGESGYTTWLADPQLLPFTTSATFAEDDELNRWTVATVATQEWTAENSTDELEAIALSLNTAENNVTYSTNMTVALKAFVFVASSQEVLAIPGAAQGKLISDITNNVLTTTDSNIYQLTVKTQRSDNSEYITVEQETNYTMTQNRHVFGEEYLWGLHKKIVDGANTEALSVIWSGDSTTYGDNSNGFTPSVLGGKFAQNLGVFQTDDVNAGHSGQNSTMWLSTYIDADLAAYPDMDLYIARWGINDGSSHADADLYIANMDAGLAKLRVAKTVTDLTIVVMAPSATYDDPNNRGTAWYETIIPMLRRICRKHQAVFFDTYSIWQDAKQGAGFWLDNPYSDGRGIHPDAAFNHQIISRVCDMVYAPVMNNPSWSVNGTINVSSTDALINASTSPSSFNRGESCFRADLTKGWPLDGAVWTKKSANEIVHQTVIEYAENTEQRKQWRVGDPVADTWSEWQVSGTYIRDVTLESGWSFPTGFDTLRVVANGRSRTLVGACKNIGGEVAGAIIGTIGSDDIPTTKVQGVAKTQNVSTYSTAYIEINTAGEVKINQSGGDGNNLSINVSWHV